MCVCNIRFGYAAGRPAQLSYANGRRASLKRIKRAFGGGEKKILTTRCASTADSIGYVKRALC